MISPPERRNDSQSGWLGALEGRFPLYPEYYIAYRVADPQMLQPSLDDKYDCRTIFVIYELRPLVHPPGWRDQLGDAADGHRPRQPTLTFDGDFLNDFRKHP